MNFETLINEAKSLSALAPRPKLDTAGTYTVKVVESSYGPNQAKTGFRGVLKVEVVDGDKATALTNVYITASDDNERTALNVKPYYDTLLANGVNKSKLFEDSSDWMDVIQAMTVQFSKLIKNNKTVLLDLQLKANPKKEGEFYKNVYSRVEAQVETNSVETAPVSEEKPKKVTKSKPEPVVEAESDDESWLN